MGKKIFLATASLLALLFIVFFIWASSSMVSVNKYTGYLKQNSANDQVLTDTFTVITYNIGYLSGMTNNLPVETSKNLFTENMLALQHFLDKREADIVLFQEIDFESKRSFGVNQFEEIAGGIGFSQGVYAVNWDKQYVPFPYWPISAHFGEILSGQAVIANSKLLSNDRVVLPRSTENSFLYNAFYLDRLAQIVWLKFESDSLLLINVHFEAWDAAIREKQAKIVIDIFDRYAEDYPVILAGDFNCIPPYNQKAVDEKTIQLIVDHPLISSAINASKYNKAPSSYFTFNSESPYEKIDYIFYTHKYLRCVDSQVLHPKEIISDHLPLEAIFVKR